MACVSRYALGLAEMHRGRLEEATALAQESLSFVGSAPHGPEFFLAAQTYALLGSVAFVAGRFEDADRWCTLADETIARWREPAPLRYHADHAEAVIALGGLDHAEALVADMEARAERIPRPWLCAVAARSRGLLASARGDLDGALAAFEQSLEHQAEHATPVEQGRTLLALGQLLRRRKERRASRAALQEALAVFERVRAPLWAKRAESELARVPVRRAPSDLTPTELEIARLAATGLTNRMIAERIYVSPKTVEGALARVYRKLDIHSRAELGRVMAEREPVSET
jgi:ATP/maltotriose-dependent transcriptional regulator MalT